MHAHLLSDRRQRQCSAKCACDERARRLQPARRRPLPGFATRRDASASTPSVDALDRQPRHLVAEPELAVQPVREVEHEPAAERCRLRQHRRVAPRPRDPCRFHVDDEAHRAVR